MSEAGKSSTDHDAPPITDAVDCVWGGIYRFTCVFDREDGRHKGFEASCECKDHVDLNVRGKKVPCRKTMTFSTHGGVDRTVRLLRWWCLQGVKHKTKQMHMQAPLVEEPPSAKELEKMLSVRLAEKAVAESAAAGAC